MKPQLLFIFLIIGSPSFSQEKKDYQKDFGASVQVYPAGIIISAYAVKSFDNSNSFKLGLGGNFTNRRDFSPYNDLEMGKGFGATVAYRWHINLRKNYIIIAPNFDVWNMWIDWQNNVGEINYSSGRSYTLVIQPWIEVGYFIKLGNSPIQIGLATGFGREINIITQGEDVGQGWMNSASLSLQYSLK